MLKVGFSKKTLSKLSESQLNLLHKKIIKEATTEYDMSKEEDRKLYKEKTGNEITSDGKVKVSELGEAETVYPFSSSSDTICKQFLGGEISGAYCVVKGDGGSFTRYNMSTDQPEIAKAAGGDLQGGAIVIQNESRIMESKKSKKKNPWAICTATMGEKFGTTERSEWTTKQKNKYEKCVLGVKEKIEEGKNPYEFILEMKMDEILKTALSPKMSKSDLLETVRKYKLVSENSPAEPRTKPKPGVKPDTDTDFDPFISPDPDDQPEANSPEPRTKPKPGVKPDTDIDFDPFNDPDPNDQPEANSPEPRTKPKPGVKPDTDTDFNPFISPDPDDQPEAGSKGLSWFLSKVEDYGLMKKYDENDK